MMISAEFEPNQREEFPYLAARLWRPNDPVDWSNLCIYHYESKILYGDKSDAKAFLEYVNRQKSEGATEDNPYKIYRVDFWELTDDQ